MEQPQGLVADQLWALVIGVGYGPQAGFDGCLTKVLVPLSKPRPDGSRGRRLAIDTSASVTAHRTDASTAE